MTTTSLMSLGDFVFTPLDSGFKAVGRERSWRHASAENLGTDPSYQFTGPAGETITLKGQLLKGVTGDMLVLDSLSDMAKSGEAFALVRGDGYDLGDFFIEGLREDWSHMDAGGEPLDIGFSLDLRRLETA